MKENVIHVGMYGGKGIFGGKETPLEVDVISCDKANLCSFYKEGSCLKVRSFNSSGCKIGTKRKVKGYTRRANKYSEFKEKWNSHPEYNKLVYPKRGLGVIEDNVVFNFPYVSFSIENDRVLLLDPWKNSETNLIPKELFTTDLIYKLVNFKPRSLMGGVITDYQKEEVPAFIANLSQLLPDAYSEFIKEYPEYDKEIDHVGRRAKLYSINPSVIIHKVNHSKEEWNWDGEYLTLINPSKPKCNVHVIRDFTLESLVIKPSENSVITVSDNDQVSKDTIFID